MRAFLEDSHYEARLLLELHTILLTELDIQD
jgi:hypothetical protein